MEDITLEELNVGLEMLYAEMKQGEEDLQSILGDLQQRVERLENIIHGLSFQRPCSCVTNDIIRK